MTRARRARRASLQTSAICTHACRESLHASVNVSATLEVTRSAEASRYVVTSTTRGRSLARRTRYFRAIRITNPPRDRMGTVTVSVALTARVALSKVRSSAPSRMSVIDHADRDDPSHASGTRVS